MRNIKKMWNFACAFGFFGLIINIGQTRDGIFGIVEVILKEKLC